MRILHLIDHLGPGGAQTILLELLEHRSDNVQAGVLSLKDRSLPQTLDRLRRAGVPHQTLNMSGAKAGPLWQLRRRMITDRSMLVHTWLDYSNIIGPAVAATLWRDRLPVVTHVLNDPVQHYGIVARSGLRLVGGAVRAHVAVSPGVARTLAGFVGDARIEVIPPGVDLSGLTGPTDARVRAELRGGSSPVIGTLARLAKQKAIDVLLEAVPPLLRAYPDLRVLIAGEGPDRNVLEERSRQLGIDRTVRFLGHRSDVAEIYHALDVFVLPSRHEGYPVVVVEAMAAGVPVVATRVVGSMDAIEDGWTGLLVAPEDPTALATAIGRLLGDRKERLALADRAARFVSAERSVEAMTARIEALYAEFAGRGK